LGSFNDSISLACSGLPSDLSCAFAPGAITPGSNAVSSRLTVSAVSVTGENREHGAWELIYASALLPVGTFGFSLMGDWPRRRQRLLRMVQNLGAVVALAAILFSLSCGGVTSLNKNGTPPSTPHTYSITVNGSSSTAQLSTMVAVTVN
jgi:hypothetical protein